MNNTEKKQITAELEGLAQNPIRHHHVWHRDEHQRTHHVGRKRTMAAGNG